MHNESTPAAFIEGINDPEFWANFCRTSDYAPKNALKHRAPKYDATVSLNYLDGTQAREIISFKATSQEDASDLALLLAGLDKPGQKRMIIVSQTN